MGGCCFGLSVCRSVVPSVRQLHRAGVSRSMEQPRKEKAVLPADEQRDAAESAVASQEGRWRAGVNRQTQQAAWAQRVAASHAAAAKRKATAMPEAERLAKEKKHKAEMRAEQSKNVAAEQERKAREARRRQELRAQRRAATKVAEPAIAEPAATEPAAAEPAAAEPAVDTELATAEPAAAEPAAAEPAAAEPAAADPAASAAEPRWAWDDEWYCSYEVEAETAKPLFDEPMIAEVRSNARSLCV